MGKEENRETLKGASAESARDARRAHTGDAPSREAVRPYASVPALVVFSLLPAATSLVAIKWEFFPKFTYTLGKIVAVVLPVLVWKASGLTRADLFRRIGLKRTAGLAGLAAGAVLSAAILVPYYLALKGAIDPSPILAKAASLDVLKHYWLMALAVSAANSLFEEYYWRAFLLERLMCRINRKAAVWALAGALFGVHHFIVLSSMLPLSYVLFFTFGTVLAGAFWSWMRLKGYSILDCYVSHVLADVAVLWAGWDLINEKLL